MKVGRVKVLLVAGALFALTITPVTQLVAVASGTSSETPQEQQKSAEQVEQERIQSEQARAAEDARRAEEIAAIVEQKYEEFVKAEEAVPVENFTSEASMAAIPAEVKARTEANLEGSAAIYNLSNISTARGFISAVNKISAINAANNSAVSELPIVVYSKEPMVFNTEAIAAIGNLNTTFEYIFNYNGNTYKVSIPAGTIMNLEGTRFAGPLYLGSKFGSVEVIN